MSYDTSHVEGPSEVDFHVRLTAIDADRVVGKAHQSAYPRFVFTEVVRGGAIGHSTCDFRPTDVTAVDGSIEILFARHTQFCTEQSGSNTLRVGGAVIDREYHLCVGDIEVAHISLAVPKESIAVAASTTFYSYLHLVDGFTIAVEITLKGIVLVDTDGYPVALHSDYVNSIVNFEVFPLESFVLHVHPIGKSCQMFIPFDQVRTVLCS